jgi:MFS family permease
MGSLANFDHGGHYSAYLPAAQGLGQIVGPNIAASILSYNLGYESVFIMCWSAAMLAMIIYWLLYRFLRATNSELADAS